MSKYWYAHCAVHMIDEDLVLLRFYIYFLSTFENATTVGGVVNWIPAAGCQRDIQATTSTVEAVIWWWMKGDNNCITLEIVRSSWKPVRIKGNADKYL